MLIPLTDSTNPYTAMMLELIASHDDRPHSHVWRVPNTRVASRRRRLPIIGRFLPRRRSSALAPTG